MGTHACFLGVGTPTLFTYRGPGGVPRMFIGGGVIWGSHRVPYRGSGGVPRVFRCGGVTRGSSSIPYRGSWGGLGASHARLRGGGFTRVSHRVPYRRVGGSHACLWGGGGHPWVPLDPILGVGRGFGNVPRTLMGRGVTRGSHWIILGVGGDLVASHACFFVDRCPPLCSLMVPSRGSGGVWGVPRVFTGRGGHPWIPLDPILRVRGGRAFLWDRGGGHLGVP